MEGYPSAPSDKKGNQSFANGNNSIASLFSRSGPSSIPPSCLKELVMKAETEVISQSFQ
jgi:hypothetical protein